MCVKKHPTIHIIRIEKDIKFGISNLYPYNKSVSCHLNSLDNIFVIGCPNLVFTTSVKHKFCCVIHPITFPPRPIFYISPPKFPFFNQTSLASNRHGSRDSTRPKWNFSTISAISVWLLIPYDALKPWFSINLFTACQLLSEMQDC